MIVAGRPVPDWMSTLDQMARHGTRIRFSCQACREWRDVALGELAEQHGPAGSIWDVSATCASCGGCGFYLASPGASTPFRPLLSSSQANRKSRR